MSLNYMREMSPESPSVVAQQLIEERQEMVGVSKLQVTRYQRQRLFFFNDPTSQELWGSVKRDTTQQPGVVQVVNIIGEAGGVAKTRALGEVAVRNFDIDFIQEVFEVNEIPPLVQVTNMTIAASSLKQMPDGKGGTLVWNKAHSWEPIERERSLYAMQLAIERARQLLPFTHPEFQHVIGVEYLLAFLGPDGIDSNGYFHFRKTNFKAQEMAGKERATYSDPTKNPNKEYARHGGYIDDPSVSGEVLEDRMGSFASMLRQRAIVNDELKRLQQALKKRGVIDFNDNDLDNMNDQGKRNDVIVPGYFRYLMEKWGVRERVNGVIVPNTLVDRIKHGYFYKAIETFQLPIEDYVRPEEILRAVG